MMEEKTLEQRLLDLLLAAGKTVTTAESCTGGLVAKRLTDTPGSSAVYPGGFVTYCDAVKTALVGVPADLLEREGAVSAPVARAMAQGARNALHTNYALATTGLAGPDGDGSGKPVGLIYVALADGEETQVRELHLGTDREKNREEAAQVALEMLYARLENP
jgi:PncC family amidohydrolase